MTEIKYPLIMGWLLATLCLMMLALVFVSWPTSLGLLILIIIFGLGWIVFEGGREYQRGQDKFK